MSLKTWPFFHLLRKDDLFIDIGANVGSYTILACSAIGAKGYAFKPIPDTYEKLIENIRLNHLEDEVTCLNMGLGDKTGTLSFSSDMDTVNHVLVSGELSQNPINVQVSTLDEVLGDNSPALIKIDVEGYEFPVLEGAMKTLSQKSLMAVIIELNGQGSRYGFDEAGILPKMFNLGFQTYSYNPFNRILTELKGKNLHSDNILFIRKESLSLVKDRLENAPTVSIHGMKL